MMDTIELRYVLGVYYALRVTLYNVGHGVNVIKVG